MYQHIEEQAFQYLGLACVIPALLMLWRMKNIGVSLLLFGYCAAVFTLCSRAATFMASWADQDLLIGVGAATLLVAVQAWRIHWCG